MLCGFIYKKWLAISFTMVGIFSLLFGILLEKSLTPDAHSLNMMAGMLSGLGGTFTVVGIIRFIYLNIHSSEKLKLDELQHKDERNTQIVRMAFTITAIVSILLFLGMAFLFLRLNYMVPALVSIGCLYFVMLIYLISRKYYNGKM